MSPECDFFNGVDTVKCKRVVALAVARENLGCAQGELIELAEVMCKQEEDYERRKDCPAFRDLEEFKTSSPYAIRSSR